MTFGSVKLPDDSANSGKAVRNVTLTEGGGTVYGQVTSIGDPTASNVASVKAASTPAADTDQALVVATKTEGTRVDAAATSADTTSWSLTSLMKGVLAYFLSLKDTKVTGTVTAADTINLSGAVGTSTGITGAPAAGSFVPAPILPGQNFVLVQTTAGTNLIYWEISYDSTNGSDGTWYGQSMIAAGAITVANGDQYVSNMYGSGTLAYEGNCTGATYFRARCTSYTGSQAFVIRASIGIRNSRVEILNTISATIAGGTAFVKGAVLHSATLAPTQTYPVVTGGKVITSVDTTLVAADVSQTMMTTSGATVVKQYSVPETDWQATSGTAGLTATTSTSVKTAGAAGVRNYVTALQAQNTSATASVLTLLDGATVIWTCNMPASMALPVAVVFPTPLRGTAATAVNIQQSAAGTILWNAQGYQAA